MTEKQREDVLKREAENIRIYSNGIRRGVFHYLKLHPEFRAIARILMREVIDAQPKGLAIIHFFTRLFDSEHLEETIAKINVQLTKIQKDMRKFHNKFEDKEWAKFDDVMNDSDEEFDPALLLSDMIIDCKEKQPL